MEGKKSHREISRLDYNRTYKEGQSVYTEDIQTGCLQRIADGVEIMSKGYDEMKKDLEEMTKDRDRIQKMYWDRVQRVMDLNKKISSIEGWVTRYKNKLKAANVVKP